MVFDCSQKNFAGAVELFLYFLLHLKLMLKETNNKIIQHRNLHWVYYNKRATKLIMIT